MPESLFRDEPLIHNLAHRTPESHEGRLHFDARAEIGDMLVDSLNKMEHQDRVRDPETYCVRLTWLKHILPEQFRPAEVDNEAVERVVSFVRSQFESRTELGYPYIEDLREFAPQLDGELVSCGMTDRFRETAISLIRHFAGSSQWRKTITHLYYLRLFFPDFDNEQTLSPSEWETVTQFAESDLSRGGTGGAVERLYRFRLASPKHFDRVKVAPEVWESYSAYFSTRKFHVEFSGDNQFRDEIIRLGYRLMVLSASNAALTKNGLVITNPQSSLNSATPLPPQRSY